MQSLGGACGPDWRPRAGEERSPGRIAPKSAGLCAYACQASCWPRWLQHDPKTQDGAKATARWRSITQASQTDFHDGPG
eukprot:5229787-Pyramimonas_sp.AAC.1